MGQSRAGDQTVALGIAFLLAQLGAHATQRFIARIARLELTAPQAGLLRIIDAEPGINQRTVAQRLGTPPSRLVALVDGLEERGIVRRERCRNDRRNYALNLTDRGQRLLVQLDEERTQHEQELCAGLDDDQRAQLHRLLDQMATALGLTPNVHPGYRALN